MNRDRQRAAADQVSVDVTDLPPGSDPPRRTVVKVAEHSVPDLRTRHPQAALKITQEAQFLVSWCFDDAVAAKIDAASADKGRRLYCLDTRLDPSNQVLAALSFHVAADEGFPLQLTALAVRLDGPELAAQSYVAAWYLLQYVCAAGVKLGRGPGVLFATADPDAALEDLSPLGFQLLLPSSFKWPKKTLVLSA